MTEAPIKAVVSTCAAKDLPTWSHTAPNIVRFIAAERYCVVVPSQDLDAFRVASPARYEIIDEAGLIDGFSLADVKRRMAPDMRWRAYWYYQQILKLLAIREVAPDPDDVALIWDADTLPLRPLDFVRGDGGLNYFRGLEHHPPYFEAIRTLLGLEKKVGFSFVAQCFALYRAWLDECLDLIEARSDSHWIDAILSVPILDEISGFSEYETLGTFIAHRHPDRMMVNLAAWERDGTRLYGAPDAVLGLPELAARFAYVSFESYQAKPPTLSGSASPPPSLDGPTRR